MAFELPALTYAYDALEPHIDAQTMQIHHTKHHGGYVANANAALESAPELKDLSIEEILADLNQVPEGQRTNFQNNGGGHANHSLFWKIMSPNGGGEPNGSLAQAISKGFGSIAAFQEKFSKAALTRFGSGWAWLVVDPSKMLRVLSTPNQDSPILQGLQPVLGLDVWEHAYYLKYQNRRAEYVAAWWNVVHWEEIGRIYEALMG